jgi:hypothetical protein
VINHHSLLAPLPGELPCLLAHQQLTAHGSRLAVPAQYLAPELSAGADSDEECEMRVTTVRKVDLHANSDDLLRVCSRYRRETAVFAGTPSHCCLGHDFETHGMMPSTCSRTRKRNTRMSSALCAKQQAFSLFSSKPGLVRSASESAPRPTRRRWQKCL